MHYLCFFYSWSSHVSKGFLFRRVNWIPSRAAASHNPFYGRLLSLCRSVSGLSWIEALSGVSFQAFSIMIARVAHGQIQTEWLHLAPCSFIPPMRLLMIFWAVPYMLLEFPRMYCKTMEKMQREILRHTQVNITANQRWSVVTITLLLFVMQIRYIYDSTIYL